MTPRSLIDPRRSLERASSPAARIARRALQSGLVATLLFGGCTCAGKPPESKSTASASPVAVRATPTTVAAAPKAAAVAPPTAAAPPPAAAAPPAAAEPPATPDTSAERGTCEAQVAILAGRTRDARLDDPDLRALAAQAPDLVTCVAVATDSDAMCTKLFPVEHGPSAMCLHMRAIFHELRTYPQGRSFLLDEVDVAQMQPLRARMPAAFDALRAATRSGDVAQCEQAGDLRSICIAYVTLDPEKCVAQGDIAAGKLDDLMKYKEGDTKTGAKYALEDGCRQIIQSRSFLSAGLKGVAQSGPPRERALAKAALGDAEACAAYAKAAVEACLVTARAGTGSTPVANPPAPGEPPAGEAPPAAAPVKSS